MSRLERLTTILIQLQSKRIIKAQEIADRFEISLRTVYRDIRTLEEAGVPILSEAGIGYSLVKDYRLPPVHFTQEEALSFLTAERLVSKFADKHTTNSFNAALYKIKSVLRHADKELLDDALKHIEVIESQYLPPDRNEKLDIKQVLDAAIHKKVLRIAYFTGATFEVNEREIEPIGIYSLRSNWYLIAWCRLRKDYRNFRVDRIKNFEVLSERFTSQHPELRDFINRTRENEELIKVVIRIDKNAFKYLGDQQYYMGFVSQEDLGNQIEMTFLTSALHGFAHWFMYLGKSADIIEPPQFKETVLELIEKTTNRIKNTIPS